MGSKHRIRLVYFSYYCICIFIEIRIFWQYCRIVSIFRFNYYI
nr:MAG TPA: hypothetical protein [Caudoviricetes sp.]